MSCQNTEDVRIIVKYSSFPGEEPTIPNSANHEDGTWLPTDIYVGEMFINAFDNKAWVRGINGIFPIGATGGTMSFIGDFVPASTGGTFSGPVTTTTLTTGTVSTGAITASNIWSDVINANYFIGDGSGLTNIVANWNGGTVSNPVAFTGDTYVYSPLHIEDSIVGPGNTVEFNSNIEVANGYGISASYFYGDGSFLTNLPVGTYSNDYTTSATLSGNTIIFDRTDLSNAYSVDLTPILATDSIAAINWDSPNSQLQITYTSGYEVITVIDSFSNLSTNILNVNSAYGGTFYGTFDGTFSNDIYTTSATLVGTTAEFSRTDGSTYSLDLSSFSGGGSGSVGPTGPAGATGATGSTPYMVISYNSTGLTLATGSVTLPITTTLLIGWSQGTRVRIWNDATHYMEGQITTAMTYPQIAGNDILVDIDYVVGTGTFGVWKVAVAGDVGSSGVASQTLAQTLILGNNTGNTDIELNNNTFTSNSDSIRAAGNTYDDARISYEDFGGGAWAPIMKVWNGDYKSHVLVASETQLFNSRVGGAYNHYSNYVQDFSSISMNVADLTNANGTTFELSPVSIVASSTTPTFQGVEYASDYSANFTNRSLVDKEYVDGLIVTPSLSDVMTVGNNTSNKNIIFNNAYGLENSTGEADIKMDAYEINVVHQKYTTGTDWKRGLFQGSGHNGVASLTGDDYNVTSDLYRGSSLDATNTYARLFYQETQISTGNGYQTYTQINKDNILVSSAYNSTIANSNFTGIEYNHDYSANFTARSLVDKAYVDAAVAGATGGGGATPSLAQVLSVGSQANTSIDMNGNDIFAIDQIGVRATFSGGYIEFATNAINLVNATMLTLMYNT